MKFWTSFLLGLLITLYFQSCVEGQNAKEPDMCCFTFYEGKIPLQRIMKYQITSTQCVNPGVVFTTWSGKHVCMKPADKWVKQTMVRIDKRTLGS